MGIEKIKEKILEDAKNEVRKIIAEAEEERKKILEEAKKEAERRKEQILKKGEKEAEMIKNRIIAEAKLEAKKMILKTKEELIEKAIVKLREDLLKYPESNEYKEKLIKLIMDGAIALGGGEILVRLNERDDKLIDAQVLWNLEKTIEDMTGKVTILKKGKPVNIIGGCILESSDGFKVLDNSLEAIFDRNLPNIRSKVMEILFS
ncbi:H+transporting two-sector ATPase E subunit [Methanocaldococcus villosus KIN24-T80]|uniref:A-type ATP synthase subunit E n=1 Tax=Methanocaldococcus villosus KIN24-T80 TaxID=1069083 RepID=N6VSF9_9EURY|nr:V-type ATP synthase subunit E [Methanocaldococcus villosus]ENN96081.1 H+transporting two-sector ATPase E subunit [Methanocaldococcus villosus KIN24-T80]